MSSFLKWSICSKECTSMKNSYSCNAPISCWPGAVDENLTVIPPLLPPKKEKEKQIKDCGIIKYTIV